MAAFFHVTGQFDERQHRKPRRESCAKRPKPDDRGLSRGRAACGRFAGLRPIRGRALAGGEAGLAGSPRRTPDPAARTERFGRFFGQVAQLVEHATENRGVGGSIPSLAMTYVRSVAQFGRAPVSKTGGWGFESLRACGADRSPHRLTVRTPLFQGGDRGSIPREGMARDPRVPGDARSWGCSSVRLECRSVTPEAAGSSPVSPALGRLFENAGWGP